VLNKPNNFCNTFRKKLHGVLHCTLVALFFVVENNIAYTPTPLYSLHFENTLMATHDLKIKVLIPTKFSYKIRESEKKKLISEGYAANWP
jgi:hypothetical protein